MLKVSDLFNIKILMKNVLTILFLLIVSITYAHSDIIFSTNNGNRYLEHQTSFAEFEINAKISIFEQLLDKLIETKKYKTPCYIYFQHAYRYRKPLYYTLSYGKFHSVLNTFDDKDIEGINLIIRAGNFDIKELLNLINNAFENIELLKQTQKELFFDLNATHNGNPLYDTLYSIDNEIIKQYKQQNDEVVNQLIQEKTHKFFDKSPSDKLDYFYQNNQFHFYNHKDKIILSVDSIFEVFGNSNYHFVFINDSMFYHFHTQNQRVNELLTIPNLSVYDRIFPIDKFYYEFYSEEKYFLIFRDFMNFKKVLFLPNEGKVISNYNEYEDELIDGFINEKEEEKPSNDYLIWWLLGISLVINGWLLLRLKNRK